MCCKQQAVAPAARIIAVAVAHLVVLTQLQVVLLQQPQLRLQLGNLLTERRALQGVCVCVCVGGVQKGVQGAGQHSTHHSSTVCAHFKPGVQSVAKTACFNRLVCSAQLRQAAFASVCTFSLLPAQPHLAACCIQLFLELAVLSLQVSHRGLQLALQDMSAHHITDRTAGQGAVHDGSCLAAPTTQEKTCVGT